MNSEELAVESQATENSSELIEAAVASISLEKQSEPAVVTTTATGAKKKKKKNKKNKSKNIAATTTCTEVALLENKDDEEVVRVVEEYVLVEQPLQLQEQPQQQIVEQPNAENFDNLQKAVQILGKAKLLDESKQFDAALKLYRQGVDMLIEELIGRQGTDQSRLYLRNKCNDFMNRIDQLKMIIRLENSTTANKENAIENA